MAHSAACLKGRTDYEACFAPFRYCPEKGCGQPTLKPGERWARVERAIRSAKAEFDALPEDEQAALRLSLQQASEPTGTSWPIDGKERPSYSSTRYPRLEWTDDGYLMVGDFFEVSEASAVALADALTTMVALRPVAEAEIQWRWIRPGTMGT